MARKNALKKFFMYVVVAVGIVFLGFMTYYFAKNNENIFLTVDEGSIVYVNKGEVVALPLSHTKPNKSTTFEITYTTENVVEISAELKTITALNGGATTVTITSSNENFGPYKFDILVGEGTKDNPWYISSATQLVKIGKNINGIVFYETDDSYEMVNNINLSTIYSNGIYWTPIEDFYGTFSGEGYEISNLKVQGSYANVGLFGKIHSTARVENLKLTNAFVVGEMSTNVGIVAGVNAGFIGKVSVVGNLISSSQNSYVGGIVGKNVYEGTRPTLNMVEAKVQFRANGTIGGLVGINQGGIVFNSNVSVESLDLFLGYSPFSQTLDAVFDNYIYSSISFGGIIGRNEAIIYNNGTSSDFRQGAIKNSIVSVDANNLVVRSEEYYSRLALVVFENVEVSSHLYAINNTYLNIYAKSYGDLVAINILNGGSTSSITILSRADFNLPSSFDELNFETVWGVSSNEEPSLNLASSYEIVAVTNPGEVITSAQDVIVALKTISQNIGGNLNFLIDAQTAQNNEIVVDMNDVLDYMDITQWQPLGTLQNPFIGQLEAINGFVVFENLVVENDSNYLGLFGVISNPNTLLKNIKIRNATIKQTSVGASYGASLVAYIESGTVSNIYVDNASIEDVTVAGFVAGYNKNGIITNCFVGNDYLETQTNEILNSKISRSIYLGGIVGISASTINNVTVKNATIKNNALSFTTIGGIVAKILDKVEVSNAYNDSLIIDSINSNGYYGGVVGYVNANAVVKKSYNLGDISSVIGIEDESYAGGVASYVGKGAVIETSFSNTYGVKAKYVGGIVAINKGLIKESYSLGEYVGDVVGGLAYLCEGEITHSYTKATVKSISTSKDDFSAGLVAYLPKGAKISYVFGSATILATNGAQKYAETRSYIRYTFIETFFDELYTGRTAGEIKNYFVVNFNDAIVQTDNFNIIFRSIGIAGYPKDFIITTEDDVLGYGTINPFETAGFQQYSPQIWIFEDGQWPTLANVITSEE